MAAASTESISAAMIHRLAFGEGGFVALDTFFVMSGFLITGLVLKEMNKTGTLSLSRFYARRVRRLHDGVGPEGEASAPHLLAVGRGLGIGHEHELLAGANTMGAVGCTYASGCWGDRCPLRAFRRLFKAR